MIDFIFWNDRRNFLLLFKNSKLFADVDIALLVSNSSLREAPQY